MTFQQSGHDPSGRDTGRPITDLVSSLVGDISGLFRKEIELARVEATEKLSDVARAGRSLAIGAILAIGALGVVLTACVIGLAALMVTMGIDPTLASVLAALIVAVVVGAIAWSMIGRGLNDLTATKLNMDRTAHSIRMDAAAVRESI